MSFIDDLSGYWQDVKDTATGFIISVKEGNPLPANPADYWSQQTGLDLHPSNWYNNTVSWIKDQFINVLVIGVLVVVIVYFSKKKIDKFAGV